MQHMQPPMEDATNMTGCLKRRLRQQQPTCHLSLHAWLAWTLARWVHARKPAQRPAWASDPRSTQHRHVLHAYAQGSQPREHVHAGSQPHVPLTAGAQGHSNSHVLTCAGTHSAAGQQGMLPGACPGKLPVVAAPTRLQHHKGRTHSQSMRLMVDTHLHCWGSHDAAADSQAIACLHGRRLARLQLQCVM
jgi:hypothetical protein